MARSFVSGPHAIDEIDSAFQLGGTSSAQWIDAYGGIVVCAGSGSTVVGEMFLIKPDGKTIKIGDRAMNLSGVGWSYDDKLWCRAANTPNRHSQFDFPHLAEGTQVTDASIYSGITSGGYAVMSNRILQFDGNRVRQWPLPSGAATTECVILSASVGPGGLMFPADLRNGRNLWWLYTPSTGLLHQYNATTMLEVVAKRSSLGAAATWACYSRKHDMFSVLRSGDLNHYANETYPASISAPTFASGPTATKQSVCSTTVLGSNNEPVVNRVVEFTATVGSFVRANVLTDANGLAQAIYRSPYGASAGNTVTVTLTE